MWYDLLSMDTEKLEKEHSILKKENKTLIETQQILKAKINKLSEVPPKISSGYQTGRTIYKRQERLK